MEAFVFEHVPKVRWTRHFCLALIAKAFLHMLNQSSHEFSDASKQKQRDTGTTWNNCLYVLFLCQVTQKLKGMEGSISDLNTTVIKSAGGAKHRFLRQKLDRR